MLPKDLAACLSVSQRQIERHKQNKTQPSEYEYEMWHKEMHLAETYLREWFKNYTR